MRRIFSGNSLATVLIGLGAFLVTMALLFRFYAVPRLAVVPLDQNSKQVVTGPNSTFFDVETLSVRKGTLTTTARVIGDPEAAREASDKTGRDLAVWDKAQVTDNNNEPPPMDGSEERIVFDRTTGEAVNCCGETANGQPVEHKGLLVKWPFFAEKKTYKYWDGSTKQAWDATFVGEEQVMGLPVWRFEQEVPRTKIGTREVPARIFGLPDKAMTADMMYENHRTFLIEPVTGVMIKLTEKQLQTIETPNAKPVIAVDTQSSFTEETVRQNVKDFKAKSAQLAFISKSGPVGMSAFGAALILSGLAISILTARRARADQAEDSLDELLDEGAQ